MPKVELYTQPYLKLSSVNHVDSIMGLCKQIAITALLVESIAEWQMLIAIQAPGKSVLVYRTNECPIQSPFT